MKIGKPIKNKIASFGELENIFNHGYFLGHGDNYELWLLNDIRYVVDKQYIEKYRGGMKWS